MNIRTLAVLLILFTGCGSSNKKKEPKPEPNPGSHALVNVTFESWTEKIAINGDKWTIIHTQTIYEFDDPTSSTPSGSKVDKLLDGKVTKQDLDRLNHFIEQCGFADLKDVYGATKGRRFYPYRIIVQRRNLESKEVLFRSNPQFEKQPQAFSDLVKYLKNLSKEIGGR